MGAKGSKENQGEATAVKKQRQLSAASIAARQAIADAGGIAPLIALATTGTEEEQQKAAIALADLTVEDAYDEAIADPNGIKPLVE